MADASDSKSDAGNSVWVQVPSPAFADPKSVRFRTVLVFLFCCRKVKKDFAPETIRRSPFHFHNSVYLKNTETGIFLQFF